MLHTCHLESNQIGSSFPQLCVWSTLTHTEFITLRNNGEVSIFLPHAYRCGDGIQVFFAELERLSIDPATIVIVADGRHNRSKQIKQLAKLVRKHAPRWAHRVEVELPL
jgi:hypothetical protein